MRIGRAVAAALALLFAGCGRGDQAGDDAPAGATVAESENRTAEALSSQGESAGGSESPANQDKRTGPRIDQSGNDSRDAQAGSSWNLQATGEGAALAFSKSGNIAVRLLCGAGGRELLVNVPAFRPVGSEERLSFGGGGEAVALVADTRGDRRRGGVSGTGPVPENLAALLGRPIAVNYGYQSSGPHAAPPSALARAFVEACRKGLTPPPRRPPPADQVSACLMQDGERLRNPALRAVGTEPFWAARIEGRCVTYSHPEDQDGTRVWTRFTPDPKGGGTWSGALGGRLFELIVRPAPGCSDGMSDRRYPYAAEVAVHGERRRGCAQLP